MEEVKKTKEYTIYKKRNERYCVKDADNKIINGADKIKILLEEKLIKAAAPKPAEPEAEAAAESTEAAAESAEDSPEDAPAEEATEEPKEEEKAAE